MRSSNSSILSDEDEDENVENINPSQINLDRFSRYNISQPQLKNSLIQLSPIQEANNKIKQENDSIDTAVSLGEPAMIPRTDLEFPTIHPTDESQIVVYKNPLNQTPERFSTSSKPEKMTTQNYLLPSEQLFYTPTKNNNSNLSSPDYAGFMSPNTKIAFTDLKKQKRADEIKLNNASNIKNNFKNPTPLNIEVSNKRVKEIKAEAKTTKAQYEKLRLH